MSAGVLEPTAERTGTIRACLFVLAGEPFAVEGSYAKEVVDFEEHTVVPRAPADLVGVANLRGNIVPILDIQPLLGMPPRRIGGTITALVVEAASFQVAIAIDDALGLEPFDEVLPFAEAARAQYGELGMGFLKRNGVLVPLLNGTEILRALKSGKQVGRT